MSHYPECKDFIEEQCKICTELFDPIRGAYLAEKNIILKSTSISIRWKKMRVDV